MKKIAIIFIGIILILSCKTEKQEKVKKVEVKKEIMPITSSNLENSVIYEANIRQYSKEGSFTAFTKDIPKIKKLGVKIIWVMPIFPISKTKRKATGGIFVSTLKDKSARKKALGSYYAVSSFRRINSEFGTLTDFRNLVKTAHDNGIYVILDWVPNHTGWDHEWIQEHPEFYTKGKDGKITHPLKEDGTSIGWDDVADLNYESKGLRKAMFNDMSYWLEKEGVDGFRCDVAGMVPVDFWQELIPKLRKKKNIFMLAEAWEPALLKDNLFDMCYAWDFHHLMNGIAKGEKKVSDFDKYIEKIAKQYEKDDILMNFVTNHDENSWNGTVKERMGEASEIMTVLSFMIKGMPLIYSGQEYDLDHRLKFFEKDSISKTKGKTWNILTKLGKLKNENPALNGGKNAASFTRIATKNESILAFTREKDGKKITFIGNLSNKEQTEKFNMEIKNDFFSNKELDFAAPTFFKPWKYYVFAE